MAQFEHQVCYSVMDRVTFTNGQWLGENIPESERTQESITACPLVWEYLQRAGGEGWELVGVVETPAPGRNEPGVRTLFLKRQIR